MSNTRSNRNRHAKKRKTIKLGPIILLVFVVLLAFGGFKAYQMFWKPTLSIGANDSKSSFGKSPTLTLILGVDATDQKTDADENRSTMRSDTIKLVSHNPDKKATKILSLPRDMYVPIACNNDKYDKITNGFLKGTQEYQNDSQEEQLKGGISCIKDTIEKYFDISIDDVAVVNFSGFKNIIDAIGGIDVPIIGGKRDGTKFCEQDEHGNGANPSPEAYNIGKYCFRVGQTMHLNGEQALAYARHRHMDSDTWRVKRQNQVIMLVKDQVLATNIFSKAGAMATATDSIKTTIDLASLLSYASANKDSFSNMEQLTLVVRSQVINDIWYDLVHKDAKRIVLNKFLNVEADKVAKQKSELVTSKARETDDEQLLEEYQNDSHLSHYDHGKVPTSEISN